MARQKVKMVNRLRISRGKDGLFRVRSPDKPSKVLKEAKTEEEAYKWAHRCRKFAHKEPPWTLEELEFLADNYGRMSAEDIARRLKRSTNALKIISFRKLGINQKSNIYTARALARELGLSCSKIVVAWYDRGYLKGKLAPFRNGPNHVWFFDYDDIIECLQRRPWLCRLRRMPQSYFRSIVREEWEKNPWYTRQEAAQFLGMVTVGPIERYIKRGWLPAIRRPMGGSKGEWIIRHSDLAEFQLNDPRSDHRKSATLASSLENAMNRALEKAFHALARGRWQMFGYWAGLWTQLNSLNKRESSPFQALMDYAQARKEVNSGEEPCGALSGCESRNSKATAEKEI